MIRNKWVVCPVKVMFATAVLVFSLFSGGCTCGEEPRDGQQVVPQRIAPAWCDVVAWVPDAESVPAAEDRLRIRALALPWHVIDHGTGIAMVLIPPGSYSRRRESENVAGSGSTDTVAITRAFYLSRCETAQGQWQRIMGNNPSGFNGDGRLPVDSVSWQAAHGFADLTGLRLPTQAEWEYASRAAGESADRRELDRLAWHAGNSGMRSHVVGTKAANALGLFDIIGNLDEWCAAISFSDEALVDFVDPVGPRGSIESAVMGGSWGISPDQCNWRRAGWYEKDEAYTGFGVRFARDP